MISSPALKTVSSETPRATFEVEREPNPADETERGGFSSRDGVVVSLIVFAVLCAVLAMVLGAVSAWRWVRETWGR